ncbi:MAG: glycosyltransferase family 2 protein, partial [Gammaproteobacteria bacterium]
MTGLERIACVIPARNEAATIAEVAAGAYRHLGWVIVVDDGSVDGTADRLKGLAVTLLRNPSPRGKAASLFRGARVAIADGAQAIITLDGDGQHCPDEIPRVIDAA